MFCLVGMVKDCLWSVLVLSNESVRSDIDGEDETGDRESISII